MAKFYQVGGCVRDSILGIKPKDIDYSVEAKSFSDMRAAIVERGGKIFTTNPQFFTIRASVPKLGSCDFVLCRKDGEYKDGRRPETVEMGTLLDDLARRDFTINAMAKAENGEVIDPFGGQLDLQLRVLRCVGDPIERFSEDGLRILRAIRFAVQFDLKLETDLYLFLLEPAAANMVRQQKVERIRGELQKAFRANTLETLKRLSEFQGITEAIFSANPSLWLLPTTKQ